VEVPVFTHHKREVRLERAEPVVAALVVRRHNLLLVALEILEPQTPAAVAVAQQVAPAQEVLLEETAVRAWLFLNTQIQSPFPILAAALLTQPQLRAGLLLQHLLPEPAMFLGVNDGALRIS
jgi:hypothetical protein